MSIIDTVGALRISSIVKSKVPTIDTQEIMISTINHVPAVLISGSEPMTDHVLNILISQSIDAVPSVSVLTIMINIELRFELIEDQHLNFLFEFRRDKQKLLTIKRKIRLKFVNNVIRIGERIPIRGLI